MKRKLDHISLSAARSKVNMKYEERLNLKIHAISYFSVNLMLWVVFFASRTGFPWPLFVTAGWAIGLAAHALTYYNEYGAGAVKRDAEIEAELERQQRLASLRQDLDDAPEDGALVYGLDGLAQPGFRLSDDGELPADAYETDADEGRQRES